MAQIYGELIRAQLQSATNLTIGAAVPGLVYFNSDDKKLTLNDGTDWQKLVTEAALSSSLSGKVDANAAITGATKTKITFDSKGLVTSGADLEIGDIPTITAEKGGLGEDASAFTGVLKASAGTFSAAELVDADVSATAAIAQSKIENLTTDLGNKVEANAAITGDTKTKITYDAKGLVTFGDDLTSDDIPSTLLNKFVSSTDSMTGALLLPVGTTGEQPAAAEQGMIRYNTTDATFEGYNGTAWGAIGGGGGGTTDQFTQASPVLAVGDVVYLNGSVYTKAIASAANTAEVVGVISKDPSTLGANKYEITLSGEVSGLTGLVAGEVYFLSADTAGTLTTTEPTVVGQVSLPVGVASSTTSLYVAPKRGSVVGSSNARTQIALANAPTVNTVQDISAYDAGELTGWVSITATTPLRFYVAAQFSKNGAANNFNVSYQVSGDTPPTGFSVTATAAGLLQIQLATSAISGFASASINYALNAPAVGTTFPLTVSARSVIGDTSGTAVPAGYVGEYIESTGPSTGTLTSNVSINAHSITLEAGDWDIWGMCILSVAGADSSTVKRLDTSISTTSTTLIDPYFLTSYGQQFNLIGFRQQVLPRRVLINSQTTVYLVARMINISGTTGTSAIASPTIFARRRN